MFSFNEPPWVIHRITQPENKIFLTFDDGPSPETTPQVLDLLKKYQCTATFFVIGEKAQKNLELLARMIREGHSVLSHSVDHKYANYFKSTLAIQSWLDHSIKQLEKTTAQTVLGFRPPAGILNPPLLRAAQKLQLPLILWSYRYFDTVFKLTSKKVQTSLQQLIAGDIVLLHDAQKIKNRDIFLKSLEELILGLKKSGLQISALSDLQIRGASRFNCVTRS